MGSIKWILLENLESRDLGLAQISTSQEPRIPKTLNPEPLHHNFKALRTEFESLGILENERLGLQLECICAGIPFAEDLGIAFAQRRFTPPNTRLQDHVLSSTLNPKP